MRIKLWPPPETSRRDAAVDDDGWEPEPVDDDDGEQGMMDGLVRAYVS